MESGSAQGCAARSRRPSGTSGRADRMKRSSFGKRFTSSSISARRGPDEASVNSFAGAGSAWRSGWRSSHRRLRSGTHSPHPFRGVAGPEVVSESLLIGGWVAMWRPLEVFLYDWWPIREEARLCDRLSAMPVKIVYEAKTTPTTRGARTGPRCRPPISRRLREGRCRRTPPIQSSRGLPHDTGRDEPASAHGRRGTTNPGSRS